jgi:hypothetical protein
MELRIVTTATRSAEPTTPGTHQPAAPSSRDRDVEAAPEPAERRLIAEYEDALTAALAETDNLRASEAFDRADRLQARLLRLGRTKPDTTWVAAEPEGGDVDLVAV